MHHHGHSHGHSHAHGTGHHDPAATAGRDATQRRRLLLVLGLTASFMVAEVLGGLFSGSLALLADAGHMFADSSALMLSYGALWLANRPVSSGRTFGFRRAELLAAFINALGLVGLAVWIAYEALTRMAAPVDVNDTVMLVVAVAGLGINVVGILLLHQGAQESLNLRGAMLHMTGDLLGSVGAIASALIIRYTGQVIADPIIGLVIGLLIAISGLRLLWESGNFLMDSVPNHVSSQDVQGFLENFGQVRHICDLHVWGISSMETMLTAHLVVDASTDREKLLDELLHALQERFSFAHMTVQMESRRHPTCPSEW